MSDSPTTGGELFIVDNSDEAWKGLKYLHDWTEIASAFDIATGYFEIGALLALDGKWQKLGNIRILMGNEVSARTQKAILEGLQKDISSRLDASIESEKEKNDFLAGVPAIVQALRDGKIQCRAYSKRKFHAKAYITHPKVAVIGSVALVGSSNFTVPGLTQNIELNIQIRAPGDVSRLQEWYDKHWQEGEDITADILKVVERHIREYTPFDVYTKALDELFRRHELTASEWEKTASKINPILDQYQRDGYASLYHTAANYNGAFLCDGVGLGKTFIGLMLIERLVMYEKKRVVLFVPKSGRVPVWERNIKRYLPHLLNGFLSFKIFNHTDLTRGVSADGTDFPSIFEQMREQADVIIIDEAHHFRNRGLSRESGGSRYWTLYDLCEGKQVYHLTATPVNNALTDFQHLIELFSRQKQDAFAPRLGIHNLAAHFQLLEKQLAGIVRGQDFGDLFQFNQVEAGQVLFSDRLFRELVVQRSRAYVIESQKQQGSAEALFPQKEAPRVAEYSVKKTYGHLLGKVEIAFAKEKPLFALAPYHPLDYPVQVGEIPAGFEIGRQRGLVRLIRVQFLKRFESSIIAFEQSCQNLLLKFLAFLEVNGETAREKARLEKWRKRNEEMLAHIKARRQELSEEDAGEEQDEQLGDEFLEHFEPLDRKTYRLDDIFDDTFDDLETLADFIEELRKFTPAHDDKLRALVKLLKTDADLKERKVLVFTEYMATARYLKQELQKEGVDGVDEVDSASKRDRTEILQQFAPYYNASSSADLAARHLKETRILIATDVLSEGLNLQDATRLINYDIHWNPVRLMQRIGRVDRRLNPDAERQLLADPMFAGTESFKPERKKTAVAFHAKDDLPEVRFRVFDLLRQFSGQLRFYAVVCDKLKLHEAEAVKRAAQPGYRFNENSVYDSLMRELFGKFHRLADRYEVCVAKRGNSTRDEAIKAALAHAEADFEKKFGFRRSHPDAWTVTVQSSKDDPCLQAVDYFLWALQRFYEIKWNAATKRPQLDSKTGLVIREDRFLNAIWPQVGEIHDLHFGASHGTFFTVKLPLKLDERFPAPKPKKKIP